MLESSSHSNPKRRINWLSVGEINNLLIGLLDKSSNSKEILVQGKMSSAKKVPYQALKKRGIKFDASDEIHLFSLGPLLQNYSFGNFSQKLPSTRDGHKTSSLCAESSSESLPRLDIIFHGSSIKIHEKKFEKNGKMSEKRDTNCISKRSRWPVFHGIFTQQWHYKPNIWTPLGMG